MRWFYCKKEDYVPILCTDPQNSKYQLRISPNSNFDKEQVGEQEVDTRFLLIHLNNVPSLQDIKNKILSLQAEYDNSAEVNSFYLNGKRVWLDKATRVGLFNLLNIEKTSNTEKTTLWFNGISIEIEVNKAITLLTAVEKYAKQCYNNTQEHYAEINKLSTIEKCLKYDITAGYPAILNITLTD